VRGWFVSPACGGVVGGAGAKLCRQSGEISASSPVDFSGL